MPGKNTEALDPKDLIVCFSCLGWLGCADTMGLNGYIGNWCTVNANLTCCCTRCGVNSCRWSDVEGECCVLAEANSKQVMPTSCCKATGQTCCLDQRVSFPREDDENAEVPCMCAVGGINLAVDNQCRMGCCQSVHNLRHGEVCSDSCPFVMGTCGDCTCCTACCSPPDETAPPTSVAAPVTGVAKAQPSGGDDIPNKPTAGETIGAGIGAGIDSLGTGTADVEGKTKVKDLNTCLGCCCGLSSLYCRFPEIFGCFGEGVVFGCLSFAASCCKPLIKTGEVFDNDICLCTNTRFACITPSTCFMCTCQEWCMDSRIAIPCNGDEVPCVVNCCWINCMYEYACKTGCTLWTPLGQFAEEEGMANQEAKA